MKKCPYCGQEYSDETEVCLVDQYQLRVIETNSLASNRLLDPEPGFHFPKKVAIALNERDNGLWLVWKCPRCQQVKGFNAVVSRANIAVVGLEISSPLTMIDLRCTQCKYEFRVDPSEREVLENLRNATRLLGEGNISWSEYEEQVLRVPARFLKNLTALTHEWKCPNCGEENPISFDTCWSCSSGENAKTEEVSEDAKPFPGIPRGGNSWEQ